MAFRISVLVSLLTLALAGHALGNKLHDAVKAGEEAVQIAKASPDKPSTTSLEKQIAEWKVGK